MLLIDIGTESYRGSAQLAPAAGSAGANRSNPHVGKAFATAGADPEGGDIGALGRGVGQLGGTGRSTT